MSVQLSQESVPSDAPVFGASSPGGDAGAPRWLLVYDTGECLRVSERMTCSIAWDASSPMRRSDEDGEYVRVADTPDCLDHTRCCGARAGLVRLSSHRTKLVRGDLPARTVALVRAGLPPLADVCVLRVGSNGVSRADVRAALSQCARQLLVVGCEHHELMDFIARRPGTAQRASDGVGNGGNDGAENGGNEQRAKDGQDGQEEGGKQKDGQEEGGKQKDGQEEDGKEEEEEGGNREAVQEEEAQQKKRKREEPEDGAGMEGVVIGMFDAAAPCIEQGEWRLVSGHALQNAVLQRRSVAAAATATRSPLVQVPDATSMAARDPGDLQACVQAYIEELHEPRGAAVDPAALRIALNAFCGWREPWFLQAERARLAAVDDARVLQQHLDYLQAELRRGTPLEQRPASAPPGTPETDARQYERVLALLYSARTAAEREKTR